MRVYFAPCGIGLGHVGRTVPIAKRLAEQKANIIFSTYREGTSYIKKEGLPLVEAPPIGFQVKPDGTIDFRLTAANPGPFLASFTVLKQIGAEIRSMKRFKPDVIVSDSRISPLAAARALQIPRVCLLNQFQVIVPRRKRFLRLARLADFGTLTLVGKMWTSGNTVLIPDFPLPYTICVGNLHIPRNYRRNVKLIGPILSVQSAELPAAEELRAKLGLQREKTIVYAPISGPLNERAFITHLLKKLLAEFPEQYEVVMSLGYPNGNTKPIRSKNAVIFDWIPNRFEYLKACDVVIARAGHGTITQCMSYGKPMVLIPTPSHTEQISNAKQASDLGVAKVIQQENVTKEKLLEKLSLIMRSDTHDRLAQVQREVSGHDGLENATKIIAGIAERKASVLS